MRWPWVSRLAFDMVALENVRLNERLDKALEHSIRIDRKHAGLGEFMKPAPRPPEPMPEWAVEYALGWDSDDVRERTLAELQRDYETLGSWDMVRRIVIGGADE